MLIVFADYVVIPIGILRYHRTSWTYTILILYFFYMLGPKLDSFLHLFIFQRKWELTLLSGMLIVACQYKRINFKLAYLNRWHFSWYIHGYIEISLYILIFYWLNVKTIYFQYHIICYNYTFYLPGFDPWHLSLKFGSFMFENVRKMCAKRFQLKKIKGHSLIGAALILSDIFK